MSSNEERDSEFNASETSLSDLEDDQLKEQYGASDSDSEEFEGFNVNLPNDLIWSRDATRQNLPEFELTAGPKIQKMAKQLITFQSFQWKN